MAVDNRTTGLFEGLSVADRAAILALGVPVRYRDGALIHTRGDAKPGLSIVVEGAVRIGKTGRDGTYIETTVVGPGQFFGEATVFADLPRTHDAIAVGSTIIAQISRPAFDRHLNDNPRLARHLLTVLTRRLHAVLEELDFSHRLPLEVRLARLLLDMAHGRTPARADASQSALAAALGVSRVSLGKALGRLKERGLVSTGYRAVALPDPASLELFIADRALLEGVISRPGARDAP